MKVAYAKLILKTVSLLNALWCKLDKYIQISQTLKYMEYIEKYEDKNVSFNVFIQSSHTTKRPIYFYIYFCKELHSSGFFCEKIILSVPS